MSNSTEKTEPKKDTQAVSKEEDSVNNDGKKVSSSDLYLNDESTLQTPAEHEKDKNSDPAKNDTVEVSK
jgi:hypothetical protein